MSEGDIMGGPSGMVASRSEPRRRYPAGSGSGGSAGATLGVRRGIQRRKPSMAEMDTTELLAKLGTASGTKALAKDKELRGEQSIRRLKAELEEMREDCAQATQIIGTLVSELDEAREYSEDLQEENATLSREVKLSEDRLSILEDMLTNEREAHEHTVQELERLQNDLAEKDQLYREAVERKSIADDRAAMAAMHPRHIHSFDAFDSSEDRGLTTPAEKKLLDQFKEERKRCEKLEAEMSGYVQRLDELSMAKIELDTVRIQLAELQDASEAALKDTDKRYEAMANEVVVLAARNAALDKERYELISELEEKDYQVQMLKTHMDEAGVEVPGGLDDPHTLVGGGREESVVRGLDDDIVGGGDGDGGYMAIDSVVPDDSDDEPEFSEYKDMSAGFSSERMATEQMIIPTDPSTPVPTVLEEEFASEKTSVRVDSESPKRKKKPADPMEGFSSEKSGVVEKKAVVPPRKPKKVEPHVPDVVREYLHLTATVIKMKYPTVTSVDSSDLLERVKHKQFWEYYDHMELVMVNEMAKQKKKEDDETRAAHGSMSSSRSGSSTSQSSGSSSKHKEPKSIWTRIGRSIWGDSDASSSSSRSHHTSVTRSGSHAGSAGSSSGIRKVKRKGASHQSSKVSDARRKGGRTSKHNLTDASFISVDL